MGYKHTPIVTETTSNKEDPVKTDMAISGGETISEETNKVPPVKAESKSDPENPVKTITTLSSAGEFKVVVTGDEFSGEATAESGQELKFALAKMVKPEGPTYGSFKYRDPEDKPVAISHKVTENMNLRAIRRG